MKDIEIYKQFWQPYALQFEIAIVFLLVCIVMLLLLVLWQANNINRATHAHSFFEAAQRLQTEELRRDRAGLFQLRDDKTHFSKWEKNEKDAVERVCHNYDVVGIMVQNKMLPKKIIIDSWGNSLYESWAAAEPFVQSLRNARGTNFWNDFEWLANKAAQWAIKNKTYNPNPKGNRARELWGEAVLKGNVDSRT